MFVSIKNVRKSTFLRNVIALSSGTILAQLINISFSPIMTRLYTPQNFGTLALFMAITGVVSNISSLCYERAIILPKDEIDAVNIVFLSVIILCGFTSVIVILVPFCRPIFTDLFKNSELSIWLWFVPLSIFLNGGINILKFWHLRKKKFNTIASAKICEASVSVSSKLCLGVFLGALTAGLIIGSILGFISSFIVLAIRSSLSRYKLHYFVDRAKISRMSKSYKKFPCFATWNALLNFFSQNLIIFVLSSFFTPSIVGFYSLGNRVLKQPIGFLSQSVQNAYFQKAASITANGYRLLPSLRKITLVLLIIGIVPFGLIALLGKYLFGIVFGSRWHMAGIFVQVMAPWFLLLFVGAPSNVVYEVLQKQDWKLILNSLKALLRGLVLIGGALISRDPFIVLILFIVVNVIFELLTILLAFTFSSRKISPV